MINYHFLDYRYLKSNQHTRGKPFYIENHPHICVDVKTMGLETLN